MTPRFQSVTLAMICVCSLFLCSGCVLLQEPEYGTVVDVKPGKMVPDFSFQTPDGKLATFQKVRGVVTVVAFSESPNWPDCKRLKAVDEVIGKLSSSVTPVTVFGIGPPQKKAEALRQDLCQCPLASKAKYIALLDPFGRIAKMYGSHASGNWYVLDYTGRVTAMGSLKDISKMTTAVRKAVREHDEWWKKLHPQTADF